MSVTLEKKIDKTKQKINSLMEILKTLETQKNASHISENHDDVIALKAHINSVAKQLRVPYKKLYSLLKPTRETSERKPLLPKYQDTAPGCESNVWSGRGIAPLWFKRYQASGRDMNDFLIKKNN
jgi:DNA-binding protein H-NS